MKPYWPGRCRRCGAPTKGSPDSWYCLRCLPDVEAARQEARQDPEGYLVRYVLERWGFENRPTWDPRRADRRRDYEPSDWEIAYSGPPIERPERAPAERLLGGLYLALLERCEDGDREAQQLERALSRALRDGDAGLAEKIASEIRKLLGAGAE